MIAPLVVALVGRHELVRMQVNLYAPEEDPHGGRALHLAGIKHDELVAAITGIGVFIFTPREWSTRHREEPSPRERPPEPRAHPCTQAQPKTHAKRLSLACTRPWVNQISKRIENLHEPCAPLRTKGHTTHVKTHAILARAFRIGPPSGG